MGTYNSAVITNGGQSMIAQAVAGASLEFTTIKTSNYAYPAGTNLATLTTINGIKQSKDITGAAVYNSRVIKISAAVDNTGISTAYTINTIGIYAKVGSSAESLFAVVTASAADTMPAYSNKPYSYIYEINLTMQNAANVTVTVNAAGLVNVADLNAAKVEIQGEIQGEIADLKSAIDALKITDTASGAIASFSDGAAMPMESLTVDMSPIQEGSGDPSPDNIRPISGRDSVTVTRTGKNLIQYPYADGDHKMINGITFTVDSMGVITANGTATANAEFIIQNVDAPVSLPAGAYTISGLPSGAETQTFVFNTYGGNIRANDLWDVRASRIITFNAASEIKKMYIAICIISGYTANNLVFKPQFESGSTASDYEPYKGQTVTIPLGQTVYGGTIDMTAGKLTVDRAMVSYDGSENWYTGAISGGVKHRMSLDSLPSGIKIVVNNTEIPDVVTNLLPAISAKSSWDGTNGISMQTSYGLRIYCDAFNTSDAAPWKAYLAEHPLTVAYKLAQPFTVQLTPEQLTTILGTNNVWSDADSVTVEYIADPKLYIDKKITAAVAALA